MEVDGANTDAPTTTANAFWGVKDTRAMWFASEPVLAKLTTGIPISDLGGGIAPSKLWPVSRRYMILLNVLIVAILPPVAMQAVCS